MTTFSENMSFAGQFLASHYIVTKKDELKKNGPIVVEIPKSIDEKIATLKLEALGIKIDTLTPEQHAYLTGWKEGTE